MRMQVIEFFFHRRAARRTVDTFERREIGDLIRVGSHIKSGSRV